MIKNARIEEGKTPSLQSGKRSEMVKEGQALAPGEKPEPDERQVRVEGAVEKPRPAF
jgi:hypothetical protein